MKCLRFTKNRPLPNYLAKKRNKKQRSKNKRVKELILTIIALSLRILEMSSSRNQVTKVVLFV